jgi:glycosyltransferase involved in cell wall biosynthesis
MLIQFGTHPHAGIGRGTLSTSPDASEFPSNSQGGITSGDQHRLRLTYLNEAFRNFGPGPAVHGHALVRELRARGVQVEIFPAAAGAGSEPGPRHRPTFRRRLRAHLPEYLNLLSGLQRTARRAGVLWVTRRNLPPDVILARHVAYDWSPWTAARLLGRPLVLEVNAAMYLEKELVGVRPPRALRKMEEAQWRRATRVHVVSRQLAEIVAGSGVPMDAIHVVPNGADPQPSCPPKREVGHPVRVLFVGGFYPWHGLEHLLRAVSLIPPEARALRLVLTGGGPESDKIRQMIASLGLGDIVDMPGRVSHAQVQDYLRSSDIAVAPYPELKPFYFSPLKLFEYMAAGLPVVASDQGQISEVIESGRTGILYPPGDQKALAEAILYLVRNPARRREIGESARADLTNRFTWGHTAEGIIRVCLEAVRDHQRVA